MFYMETVPEFSQWGHLAHILFVRPERDSDIRIRRIVQSVSVGIFPDRADDIDGAVFRLRN